MLLRSIAISAILGLGLVGPALAADDSSKQPEAAAQQSTPAPGSEAGSGSLAAAAESAAKGELKSPLSRLRQGRR